MLLGLLVAGILPVIIITGLFFSLVCRRSATALSATFFTVLAWIIVPLPAGIILQMYGDVSDWIGDLVMCLSPAGLLVEIFEGSGLMLQASVLLPMTGVWILMLVLLIRRFDRLVGRF
ncbi:MAG: hypothetical protein AAB393_17640 [Bacteroidota bacterium]